MSSPSRTAIVTGANRGVGYGLVRQLALQYPRSKLYAGPLLIYLTSRDPARGEKALERLRADPELQAAKALVSHGGPTDIRLRQLDVTSSDSVMAFCACFRKEHPDGLDLLINNAGVSLDAINVQTGLVQTDVDAVKTTLNTNYFGSLDMINEFVGVMKPHGRVVNVVSQAGALGVYSPAIQARFRNARSLRHVTELMEEFLDAVQHGQAKVRGFGASSYQAAAAGEIAFTRVVARDLLDKGSTVLVNAFCPGLVCTAMTGDTGKPVDDGAQTGIMLAFGDIGRQAGGLWVDQKLVEW